MPVNYQCRTTAHCTLFCSVLFQIAMSDGRTKPFRPLSEHGRAQASEGEKSRVPNAKTACGQNRVALDSLGSSFGAGLQGRRQAAGSPAATGSPESTRAASGPIGGDAGQGPDIAMRREAHSASA